MPEGLKKFFWRPFPTPSLRSGWLGPPLSPGLDLALSDTKYHKILRTLSLNRYAMWWFFTNVSLLSWETEKKHCFTTLNLAVKNLGTRLDRKQSYFSFSGQNGCRVTKAHQGLLQTKDSGHRLTYFFTCCFWVISVSRLLFWNNICNSNKNKFEQDWKFRKSVLWRREGLVKNTYADIRTFLVPNCYFCILMNMQGRLVDLVHVIKSVRLPNNSNCNIIISYKCVNL